ncbi:hypothetical protein RF55_16538 [Lasius niger]|uniref:Peptidase aspartic putative domain-containing protein n=1 Tax=Lasius niger TaxID=67767 RepID=A0A0J7MXH3_LASNI|nr:hypothetical protein RF55_16538 [Lasius niger]
MSVEILRKQRGYLKAKLTHIQNFVGRVKKDANAAPEEVTARLQALEEIYIKFQNVSQQLLIIDSETDPRDETEDSELDERYYTTKAELLQLLERLKPPSAGSSSDSASILTGNDTIKQFLDQQAVLIRKLTERNDNDTLVRAMEQQGQLLERMSTRSSATGREAQRTVWCSKTPIFSWLSKRLGSKNKIEAIEISEDNYVIAWELLEKRYDDERGIKRRHIQCLMDELPQIKKESASAIQELVDHIQKHLRVLQSMKLPTEEWGDLIIYIIEKNLDNATRRRWEEHIESRESVITSTMIEFLQRHGQLLRRSTVDGSASGAEKDACRREQSNKQQNSTTRSRGKATLATTQDKKCYLCQGQHLIYNCKKFWDHYSRSCRYGSCKECGERHNTLCHMRGQAFNPKTRPTRSPTESPEEATAGATLCSVTGAVRGAMTGDIESSNHHTQDDCERKRVLMATAIVNIKTSIGESQLRILLDSASELNFITATACKKLNISRAKNNEKIAFICNRGIRVEF